MKKYKILLVDDIFVNRILLSEIIAEIGSEHIEAKNGKEALKIIEGGQKVDLILMDIEMPVMNGFETTRFIRKKLPPPLNTIPVIAITAHDPIAFFEEYESVGFNALISKPYSSEKIAKVIEEVM